MLTLLLNAEVKWTLKVLSFSLNSNFQKGSLKVTCWLCFKYRGTMNAGSLFIFIELRLSKTVTKGQAGLCCEDKVKMTVERPFHFDWIVTFRKKCESKGKITVESPFHFIELRLSKYVSKRGRLAFSLNKQKWQLKVLFISLNCDFQKRSPKGPDWLGLWKLIQNYSWKSFSFSLNCNFKKKDH